jgi:hypothetical protein
LIEAFDTRQAERSRSSQVVNRSPRHAPFGLMPHTDIRTELSRWSARFRAAFVVALVVLLPSLGMVAAQGANVDVAQSKVRVAVSPVPLRVRILTQGVMRARTAEHRALAARMAQRRAAYAVAHPYVPPRVMAAWTRVAMCEEGGNWHVYGPRFSGGLGISNDNWVRFGGREFSWNASRATPQQQVTVAMRIQRTPPDQYGCHAW